MNYFQGFSKGIEAYWKATHLLFSPPFRHFLWFPVVFIVVLFLVGNYITSSLGGDLGSFVEHKMMGWIAGIPWLDWASGTAGFVVRLFVRVLYYSLFISFGGYIVMVIMSPVYSWLSERTEAHLSGTEYPFSLKQFLWEMGRGLLISFRCMFFQFFITLILFFCSFIPLVGWVTPVLAFVVSAYFYGFAFMDYAVERKRFRIRESVHYMRHNAGGVLAIGTIFTLSLMIPFIRLMVCSFVSLLSVMAGTVLVSEIVKDKKEI